MDGNANDVTINNNVSCLLLVRVTSQGSNLNRGTVTVLNEDAMVTPDVMVVKC